MDGFAIIMPIRFIHIYRCLRCASVVFLYSLFILDCKNTKPQHPTKNELLLLAVAYNHQQSQKANDCKTQYKSMNSLYPK